MRATVKTQYVCIFAIIAVILQCIDMKFVRRKYKTVTERGTRVTPSNTSVARKSCRLKPDRGPCRSNIDMYYFKPTDGTCSTFKWGGCQGNGNRFESEIECLTSCKRDTSITSRPSWCNLRFDYGFCFGSVKRYYYDYTWKVCKKTIYSGCGGNKNNFFDFDECESVCRFGKGSITRVSDEERGRVAKKVLILNPESATSKRGRRQKIGTKDETTEPSAP